MSDIEVTEPKSALVQKIIAAMAEEHEKPESMYETLIPLIENASLTEGAITDDEITDLVHGKDSIGPSAEVQAKYPLLNAIVLAPYLTASDDDEDDEEIDDEADDEADDEDEDNEIADDDDEDAPKDDPS